MTPAEHAELVARLERDMTRLAANFQAAWQPLLDGLAQAGLRFNPPDPCQLCGRNLATMSELDRHAHWTSHHPLRRAANRIRRWFR